MTITNAFLLDPRILKDVQILVVDNDRDSQDLYALLFEGYGAKVAAVGSIQAALDLLTWFIPAILICEIRFPGESVDPLLQQVNAIAISKGINIPILVMSTCSPTSLADQLKSKVEAYFLKPINIDHLVYKVWNLTLLARIAYLPSLQDWAMKQNLGKTLRHTVLAS